MAHPFKVGDQVTRIGETWGTVLKGSTHIVHALDNGFTGDMLRLVGQGERWFDPDMFKLAKSTVYIYAPGDRVKLVANRACFIAQDVGQIVDVIRFTKDTSRAENSTFSFKSPSNGGTYQAYVLDGELVRAASALKPVKDIGSFRDYILSTANEAVL